MDEFVLTAHKKKLLDSQMALTKEEGFMELDVKLAARSWLVLTGRNFGLVVEVEDADGLRKPTSSFFRLCNCSSLPHDGIINTVQLMHIIPPPSSTIVLTANTLKCTSLGRIVANFLYCIIDRFSQHISILY